jgi:hypothetical protein
MAHEKAEQMPNRGQHAEHEGMAMGGGATRSQIAAVALLTLLALGAGVFLAGLSGGLTMSRMTEAMPTDHSGPTMH